ncbi:MAG: DUF1073 domain-containing protein [Rhodoferax sp.]|jgi:hypothetical protein|uniref:anti-CBASS protein Acb1 family protein n=1 Tax=Rhodoferax sp. TaxID=50421 RepID=UPI001B6EB0C5|nr:anti-CBASS Acb1 family protein [Rhodoferax sp.]MBP9148695.1 DUF1073 domain-containing protein [Rhodoferax sp.]MBP9736271.1 DUF1073 domain-containing protein [Rhodoferax sp.]
MSQTITINATDYDLIRAREALTSFGSLDTKRPDAWSIYGYPDNLTFQRMLSAYERGGAGNGAIHRLLDGCWQSNPRIKSPASDKETPWEIKTAKLLTSIRAFAKLRDLDRRNMVGRYSALIYRLGDGKALSEPLDRAQRLVDLVPVYEDQIKVTAWNSDQGSESYGQPTMYQYRTRQVAVADTMGRPETWLDVHPSRVQILAEGSVGDMFDGVPMLRAGFNALVDIEKISGGSAESFLKNSARTMTFEYSPDATPVNIGENGQKVSTKQAHEDQVRAINRNQDAAIVTQGAKAGLLQTHTSDPTGAFQLAANLFSASVQIPFTVLFGQQTGRLASDEDKADMLARCKSRQESDLTPMVEEFIVRMQAAGIIEAGEFEVEWPDLAAPGDTEKLANLKAMTAAMKEAFGAGLQDLFNTNELRAVAGYEPVVMVDTPTEGDPLEV